MTRKRLKATSRGPAVWHFIKWPVGPMDKASASGAGDSRFESWAGHSHASAQKQAMLARSHSCETDTMAAANYHGMAITWIAATHCWVLTKCMRTSLSLGNCAHRLRMKPCACVRFAASRVASPRWNHTVLQQCAPFIVVRST